MLIHVERSSDPQVWTGQFVLSEVGLWHLRVENFDRARSIDPRCYSELPLVVASGATEQTAPRPSSRGVTLLLAIAVLAVLAGTTLLVLIRTRTTPPGPS